MGAIELVWHSGMVWVGPRANVDLTVMRRSRWLARPKGGRLIFKMAERTQPTTPWKVWSSPRRPIRLAYFTDLRRTHKQYSHKCAVIGFSIWRAIILESRRKASFTVKSLVNRFWTSCSEILRWKKMRSTVTSQSQLSLLPTVSGGRLPILLAMVSYYYQLSNLENRRRRLLTS